MGRPLESYYHGDPTLKPLLGDKAPSDVYKLNMFLADDRIIAFELVVKTWQHLHTTIVESAVAYTDIPVSTTDFINQRRRWLNGSFFATIYSLHMVTRVWKSGHKIRIPFLFIQLLHNILAFVLAWFSLSGYLLTTFIVNDITGDPPDGQADGFPFGRATPIVNSVIQLIYILTVVFQFVLALGSRPKGQVVSYVFSFVVFAVVQLYMLMNLVYLTKRLIDFKLGAQGGSNYAFINEYYSDVGDVTVLVTGASVFGVYIAAGILSLDPWHLITSWAQYMFVSTSYTNILNIYAFSNVHDVSWGDKSGKKPSLQRAGTFRDANTSGVKKEPVTPQDLRQRGGRGTFPSWSDRDSELNPDAEFEQVVRRALAPHKPKAAEEDDPMTKFMRFRTRLVAAYIFSNFLVCIIVLDQTFQRLHVLGDPYWHKVWFFGIWMWGNSALLLMKFAGMLWYRCRNLVMWIFARY